MLLTLQTAASQDIDLLLELMAGFNQEEGIVFEQASYRARVEAALQAPEFVKIWLIVLHGAPVGYAVLSFTFSLEFGGLQATIDEIYLASAERGKGLGTLVLEQLEQQANRVGAKALWADLSDEKPGLAAFYERAGFRLYPYRPYCKPLAQDQNL